MPNQWLFPTYLAVNAQNSTSSTGMVDARTGQAYNGGGLNPGIWADLTEAEANGLSWTAQGLLHFGRYRWVQVDAAATAGNIATGKLAFVVPGYSLQSVALLTPGSGQTPGTYNISAVGGGGSGAVIQVVVTAAGTVTGVPAIISAGSGYTSTPTFTVAAGGTPATVQGQMTFLEYIVTSQDKALGLAGGVSTFIRGVFLNAITPGNYGFIQEAGEALVLGAAAFTGTPTIGGFVTIKNGGAGSFDVPASASAYTNTSFGFAVDLPVISSLTRVMLDLPIFPG